MAEVLPRIAYADVFTDATITSASANETDGAVAQAIDWTQYTFWRPTGAGPHVIEITLDSAQDVNCWCIAAHDAYGLIGMDTWNGSSYDIFSEETITAADGLVRYYTGDSVNTDKLRFRFANITFLAHLYAGTDLELPEGLNAGWQDPDIGLQAKLTHEVSRDGVWLGSAIDHWSLSQSISLKNVLDTWVRDNWKPFKRQCVTQPFFLHWNKTAWPNSACLCTHAQFGGSAFSQNQFIDVSVTVDTDPGFSRTVQPDSGGPALLLESPSGALLLEGD